MDIRYNPFFASSCSLFFKVLKGFVMWIWEHKNWTAEIIIALLAPKNWNGLRRIAGGGYNECNILLLVLD